jgi:hypothetical protein
MTSVISEKRFNHGEASGDRKETRRVFFAKLIANRPRTLDDSFFTLKSSFPTCRTADVLPVPLSESTYKFICTHIQFLILKEDLIQPRYRLFQNELYNFGSLYKFIQRICTVFSTIKSSKTHRVLSQIVRFNVISTANAGCLKVGLQQSSKCCCVASVTKTSTLKGVQTIHLPIF